MTVYINDSCNALAIFEDYKLVYLCNYFDSSGFAYLHAHYTLKHSKVIKEYCSEYKTFEGNELIENPNADIPNLNDWTCIFTE